MSFQPVAGGTTNLKSAINQVNMNLQRLKAREITTVYKDTSGNRRIIIGKLPDGIHGLVISKEGFDVIEVLEDV